MTQRYVVVDIVVRVLGGRVKHLNVHIGRPVAVGSRRELQSFNRRGVPMCVFQCAIIDIGWILKALEGALIWRVHIRGWRRVTRVADVGEVGVYPKTF